MSKLMFLVTAALVAAGAFADTYMYTGGNPYDGTHWDNDWNGVTDKNSSSRYLWSSHAAPASGNDYVIDNSEWFTRFVIENASSDLFKGNSLTISRQEVGVIARWHNCRVSINNLSLSAGSLLWIETEVGSNGYDDNPYGLFLTGTPYIDGTLRFNHKKVVDYYNSFGGYLSGNLTGQGTIQLSGDNSSSGKRVGPNWRIAGNNSGFTGKFIFQLAEATTESSATGVEITSASALGGARASFTPDAVEIKSWNGLVTVGSDITLNAENSGILMQANSFFEVPANRVLTVAEPIRLTGGFFKKGAGTLALTGGFTFGADGNGAADGSNSALAVKAGVLRVTQADDLADLDVSMSGGTSLELAGTLTANFRSLSAVGSLTMVVDCTGLAPGSTQTITLNIPMSDAEALDGNVDVVVKGESGSIESELTVTQTGAAITFTVPQLSVWHNYTGTSGSSYNTSWNSQMDGDDPSKYLWDSHSAAVGTDGYIVDVGYNSVYFLCGDGPFNGGALRVKRNRVYADVQSSASLSVPSLIVDSGALFRVLSSHSTLLEGGLWSVDGDLQVCAINSVNASWCQTVPMIGHGLVTYGGYSVTGRVADQRLESDNSRFYGKFKVALPYTEKGAAYAAGLRIVDTKALGGALGVMTPDALTLEANNGLIVGESIELATENRGILMKAGSYLDVENGKTLTLSEPIRVVNGILKKGGGALVMGGGVTIGENGTSSPNGTNNKLTVQAGTIKAASTNGIAKLAFDFASGTKLELDAFPSDDGVRAGGFYFTGDTPFTAADATIPLNIAFPDGYMVEREDNVVLCTVKSANVESVTNKLSVTATGLARRFTRSFWTEDAGNGLTRIVYKFKRNGFMLIMR